jgi:hypothetical protein
MMHQLPPGAMPSPHQKAMRPPMNGPQGHPNGPGQQPNPMIRSMTPQGQQQYNIHPPPQAPSPAQNGQPMTPQQQHVQRQQMHAAQAQAQAMHQRANQSLAELQAQQSQQMQAARQQQGQGGQTPQEIQHHQQLQAMQAQQLQNATNQMYAGLGLGQVNPGIMASTAAELGWQGRDVGSMSEDERVSSPQHPYIGQRS